jgi:hypothetical protein
MIIFKSAEGRLGNQIFQILGMASLVSSSRDSQVFLLGYDDECKDILVFPNNFYLIRRSSTAYKIFRRISFGSGGFVFRLFIKCFSRELSEIKNKDCLAVINSGFFSRLTGIDYIASAYFQSARRINVDLIPRLISIQDSLVVNSHNYLDKVMGEDNPHYCMVHIRRGDYCQWPTKLFRAVLPMSFYIDCMLRSLRDYNTQRFLISSDDLDYCEDLISVVRADTRFLGCKFFLADVDPCLAIGLIAISPVKVISSSFSWAAAILGSIFFPESHIAVFAPEYWSGHRQRQWYPPGSYWDKAVYVSVVGGS